MDYGLLFAGMGTALVFFIYKTISLKMRLAMAKRLVLGIALGDVDVKVNHVTREVDLKWKEE